MIDILLPVLRRPQNAERVYESIASTTSFDFRVTFLISPDDPDELAAVERLRLADYIVVPWLPRAGDFARKINFGFRHTTEPFVFLGADDLLFHESWDAAAVGTAELHGASVIGTQDDCNPLVKRGRHATHSLVRRSYAEERGCTFDELPGVVYCEAYDHQYVDTELYVVATERGDWAFAEDALVRHVHPLDRRNRIGLDETYRKGMAHGREDGQLFLQRRRQWVRSCPGGRRPTRA